jgi:hypothetical protein
MAFKHRDNRSVPSPGKIQVLAIFRGHDHFLLRPLLYKMRARRKYHEQNATHTLLPLLFNFGTRDSIRPAAFL